MTYWIRFPPKGPVNALSRIQNCLNTRGRYTRYYVVFRTIVKQCCYINFLVDIFAVDVCYLEKCYLQYKFCLNVTNHEYCFKTNTGNCSGENTYNVWYLKPYQSIYIAQSIIDNWISIMPYKYEQK